MKVTTATVKVMQSHNYCHFEASMTLEPSEGETLTPQQIDEARIKCQLLTDKAVDQYKKAKEYENSRVRNSMERAQMEREVSQIRQKPESERTAFDKAKVKALEDFDYQNNRFDYYNDDDYPF